MADILEESLTLICQVANASPNHRIEKSTSLLRNGNFPGDGKVVYLGNITTNLLNSMESPETPKFIEAPHYNEQKWKIQTRSGPIKVEILSDSYWGFGLFNSGYVNIINISGPKSTIARLIFDLNASTPYPPWQFKHRKAIDKYLTKKFPNITRKNNQEKWQVLIKYCKQNLDELIEIMKDAINNLQRKVGSAGLIKGWSKDKAEVSIAAARYDLTIAIEALIDHNLPSVERALARIEAELIEADPENAINDESNGLHIEKSLSTISFDEDLVIKPVDDETIPLIDLSEQE